VAAELDDLLSSGTLPGRFSILAGDFNLEFPKNLPEATGPFAKLGPKTEDQQIRLDVILKILRKHGLQVTSTFSSNCMTKPAWQSIEGAGVELPWAGKVDHMIFADNVYVLASSLEAGLAMMKAMTQQLHTFACAWKPLSLQILPPKGAQVPANDQTVTLTVDAQDYTFQIVDQLIVLGGLVSADSMDSIDYRLTRATGAFWLLAQGLRCKRLPLARRFEEFHTKVISVATYSSAAWTLGASSQADYARCQATGRELRRLDPKTHPHCPANLPRTRIPIAP